MRKMMVVGVVLLAAVAFAAPAMAQTIGQTGTGVTCGADLTVWATSGTANTVPSGTWRISSWSTLAGGAGGQMAAVVIRPSGGSYTVVAVSAVETLTPNVMNTFPTSLSAKGGDILGLWATGPTNCAMFGPASYTFSLGSTPSPGDVLSGSGSGGGAVLDISATLMPATGTVQVNSMFVCYSKFEHDGGAVFPSDKAIALLMAGYWVPSAVAGNIDGGENLGAYHLECNPSPTLTPTGMYVGDGGNVVTTQVADDSVYGYYPIFG
ncbi:MAG TPA: hypothetical protein VGU02_12330 [Gaiellaceae bacterium]|nr:hypothetical protein [Gaiellaceae bacterium]